MNILIVDDDASVRRIAVWALGALWPDAVIRTAADGKTAIDALEEFRPDLVVTDLHMPRLDGLSLCRHVQNDYELSRTKVLVVTGYGSGTVREEAFERGAVEFLAKPFRADELRASALRLVGA